MDEKVKTKRAEASYLTPVGGMDNPWTPDSVDKMELPSDSSYREINTSCRFFYENDPLASSVINKTVEIAVNDLRFAKNGLTDNEIKVFTAIKDKLLEFCESMALEYLISGLVVPEISYTAVSREYVKGLSIKKYDSLVLPTDMWLRDPNTISINSTMFGGRVSYYVEVPQKLIFFIQNNGRYSDGTRDEYLYSRLLVEYPEFVARVRVGEKKILLGKDTSELVIRRKSTTSSPYPIQYLKPALESMKQKRNLRRMDYSISSRVIGAIQLFNMGSDEYPVTESDEDAYSALRDTIRYNNNPGDGRNIERIFQLFTDHTLKISWVFPPTDALLDDAKYSSVNQDIIYALGFPQLLIVGETDRSSAGGGEISMFSPKRTIENIRRKLIVVIKNICMNISKYNNFKSVPEVTFEEVNLTAFAEWMTALRELYDTGNISRTSYSKEAGFDFSDEMDLREKENEILKEKKLESFAAKPFSSIPNDGGNQDNKSPKTEEIPAK